jgi:monoamine oxidase
MPFEGTTHFIGTDSDLRTGSYATRPAGQEVLTAFFGGALAVELEQRGELEQFARDELSGIFGSQFNASLLSAVSTGWYNDPWSRGAYSAALPGRARMRERLSEALNDTVFFAGEACSTQYFGTIMGAAQTGVAAAQRVLRKLGRSTLDVT